VKFGKGKTICVSFFEGDKVVGAQHRVLPPEVEEEVQQLEDRILPDLTWYWPFPDADEI